MKKVHTGLWPYSIRAGNSMTSQPASRPSVPQPRISATRGGGDSRSSNKPQHRGGAGLTVASTQWRRQQGFTLIEIAISLVVISLILGGVLKGQELIDSARVRSLATEVTGIRAAWYSFQDRYRSLPGDFPNSRAQIDSATVPGNGNGKIDDGQERASVWQQLAMAGFISGNFDGAQSGTGSAHDVECAYNTCPKNPYNGFYKITYGTQAARANGPANEIFTGGQIPVNILAQLDAQLDDGKASSGRFRVHKAYQSSCSTGDDWDVATGHVNCAGVLRE